MSLEISKQDLYESVKTIIEAEHKHLLLDQHKLYTLFSIGFQYILFASSKDPGHYIIRVEDAKFADRLSRKAKDISTRKFLNSLLIPRKFKYDKSMFYLDFFNFQSWNMTAEIDPKKLKGALIVKDSAERGPDPFNEVDDEAVVTAGLPADYHITSLLNICPKTITIATDVAFDEMQTIRFDFIKKDQTKTISGVTLSKDVDWDSIDD